MNAPPPRPQEITQVRPWRILFEAWSKGRQPCHSKQAPQLQATPWCMLLGSGTIYGDPLQMAFY